MTSPELSSVPLSQSMREAADLLRGKRATLGELAGAFGSSAQGALLLVLALPCILPMPPGVGTVLGAAMVAAALRMAVWGSTGLPDRVARFALKEGLGATILDRGSSWVERVERRLVRRHEWLLAPAAERAVGVAALAMAVVIFLPIPFGNHIPALAVAVMALGLIARDGLAVAAGLAIVALALVATAGLAAAGIWAVGAVTG